MSTRQKRAEISDGEALANIVIRAIADSPELTERLREALGDAPNRLLTADQTAIRLGVKRETVERWCRRGRLDGQKAGRKWLIPENALPRPEEGSRDSGRSSTMRSSRRRRIDEAGQEALDALRQGRTRRRGSGRG